MENDISASSFMPCRFISMQVAASHSLPFVAGQSSRHTVIYLTHVRRSELPLQMFRNNVRHRELLFCN